MKLVRTAASLRHDSLHRNAILLIASTGIVSVLGFGFWMIATHYFSPVQIGLAASLISATSLLTNLAFLGFNNTLVRYIPKASDKSKYVNTALLVTALGSLFFSAIFMLGIRAFTPDLATKLHGLQYLIVAAYVAIAVANAMFDSLFVAGRAAHLILIKNTIVSAIKLALPVVFVSLGFMGIFSAIVVATVVGLAFSITCAYRRGIRLQANIDKEVIAEVKSYAIGNYLASVFGVMPTTLLPIMVTSVLGARHAAYFYMPMMIATLLNVIPSSAAQSLLAEASHHPEHLHKYILKTIRGILTILTPAILVILAAGSLILLAFGKDYSSEGIVVLRLLAAASIFGAINYIGDTVLNIRKEIKGYIWMNAINAALILVACYSMMKWWGLIGAGAGWLTGQVLTAIIYLGVYGKRELHDTRNARLQSGR